MMDQCFCRLVLLVVASITSFAQEPKVFTGTVVGTTPGSAIGRRLNVTQVPRPAPTCDTSAESNAPTLPTMVFSRMIGDLVCVRHTDGKSEELFGGAPFAAISSDASQIAYWLVEKRELHIFATDTRSDTLIDTLPGAILREVLWSRQGHRLTYLASAEPPGIRTIDLDSGKRNLLPGRFVTVVESPDPSYVVAVTPEGVQRIRIVDGKAEKIAAAEFATDVSYSVSGQWLGILTPPPPAKSTVTNGSTEQVDDDSPDCTGGTSVLNLQRNGRPGLLQVPFPKGFDSVLDFSFSPDDRNIAVSFGAAACDYPGDVARIYAVSLPDLKLTPISSAERLSVKAHWSPDGKTIIYSDYTASDSGLVAFDLKTGKETRLTSPHDDGPDEWLAWRINQQPSPGSGHLAAQ